MIKAPAAVVDAKKKGALYHRWQEARSSSGNRRKQQNLFDFLFNTYFTSVVQQPYGYNVTCQLQVPKDLITLLGQRRLR